MYHLDAEGKRVYTLKKIVDGQATKSAHPARFSPDDKYSRQRVTLKKRFGLLPTQQPSQCSPREKSTQCFSRHCWRLDMRYSNLCYRG